MTLIDCLMYCCTSVLTPQLQWLPEDIDNLNRARVICREMNVNKPCLIKFTKKEPKIYDGVCGENNNE